jgi:hypothetical protein
MCHICRRCLSLERLLFDSVPQVGECFEHLLADVNDVALHSKALPDGLRCAHMRRVVAVKVYPSFEETLTTRSHSSLC